MVELVRPGSQDDIQDAVHRLVQTLTRGGVGVVPTESAYLPVALATHPDGVKTLRHTLVGKRSMLISRSADDALDLLPEACGLAVRVVRRCWPGPLVLQLDPSATEPQLLRGLAPALVDELSACGLTLTVPGDAFIQAVLRLLPAPLMTCMADPVPSASALIALLDDPPGDCLAVDMGDVRYAEGPSIVEAGRDTLTVVREGVIRESSIRRMSASVVLFVCTGNTCRSPMAEALFKDMLARRLGCVVDDLPDRGFVISSAGLAAGYGSEASAETAELLRHRGIDASGHASQPLTERLLSHADFIYTMTSGHRNAILSERPDLTARVELLSRDGRDVPDPIGGGMGEYIRCQQAIEQQLELILQKLPGIPPA